MFSTKSLYNCLTHGGVEGVRRGSGGARARATVRISSILPPLGEVVVEEEPNTTTVEAASARRSRATKPGRGGGCGRAAARACWWCAQ